MSSAHEDPRLSRKMLSFALLLAVPVAMTGCSSYTDDNCNPEYEDCSSYASGGGGGYYGSSGRGAPDGSYHGTNSSSGAFKGFGSSGSHSSGG